MRYLFFVVAFFATMGLTACGNRMTDEAKMVEMGEVYNYMPSDSVTVIRSPSRVQGFDLGSVFVKRDNGFVLQALVIPYRDIPIGARMQLVTLTYRFSEVLASHEILLVR